jgi:hypothetical protein
MSADHERPTVIARLLELIAALDRRTPRPERTGERHIAAESAALRGQAEERIAQLELSAPPCQRT